MLLLASEKLAANVVVTIIFGFVTVTLSSVALFYSKEKFRLDLFDKRWEIYEHTLDFCSIVTQQGSLRATEDNREHIIRAVTAAGKSFRGIGWHKTRALFGPDIHGLFEKLNQTYSWLTVYSERPPNGTPEGDNWPTDMYNKSMFVYNTATGLPDLFKPYVYFGNYKR